MEYLVEGVPYIAQPSATECWKAAYKMMLKYKGKAESAADALPNDDLMKKRGILDAEFAICRQKIGLTSSTYKAFLTADDIKSKLQMYGPIWVSAPEALLCRGKIRRGLMIEKCKMRTAKCKMPV